MVSKSIQTPRQSAPTERIKVGERYKVEQKTEELTLAEAYVALAKLSWEFANYLVLKLAYSILRGMWKLVASRDSPKPPANRGASHTETGGTRRGKT